MSGNMAANALSKFSRIFGRRSAVVIGMIHVQALPGNVIITKHLSFFAGSYTLKKLKLLERLFFD